jgi:hypothetical protein
MKKHRATIHAMCGTCWNTQRLPVLPIRSLTAAVMEICCFCETPTRSGIYVRQDDHQALPCKGKHDVLQGP